MGNWMAIVVTAIVSAAVATSVKWLLELAAELPATSKLKETAKKTFNKNVRRLLGIIFMLGLASGNLIYYLLRTEPITRFVVAYIAVLVLVVFWWVGILSVVIGVMTVRRWQAPKLTELDNAPSANFRKLES